MKTATGPGRAVRAGADLDETAIPEWQRQSMQRSLQFARARAHARSNRFVAAATWLLRKEGNVDFTVQDVVDRSRMSIRTFYKYFASKEDLLLAVYETAVAEEAVPRLRKQIGKQKDPLLQLRAYVETLIELSTGTEPALRALTTFENRLAENRPADLARAMKPQFDLLVELVRNASRTRPLRPGLTVEAAARLTHYTVQAAAHARVLGSEGGSDVSPQAIWAFCARGMGFESKGG